MSVGTRIARGSRPYREVLAIPGVARSILLMFVARLPTAAMSLTLTLHVVTRLDRGYIDAGFVATMSTIGTMLGAPLVGAALDRYGLRPVVAVCGTVATAYWIGAPWLPYPALVAAAFPAGALVVPANSIARQVLSAAVPAERQRTAFSLDSIMVEASFIIGPAIVVYCAARYSSTAAMTAIGAVIAAVVAALLVQNPPLRAGDGKPGRPGLRMGGFGDVLSRGLAGTLLITVGALFALGGTELALVASLSSIDQAQWSGVVLAMLAVASIAGGLVHGAVRRSLPQLALVTLLAGLIVPAALVVGQPWWLLGLALMPMQLVCAPTLAATTENVSHRAPAHALGMAMGLQDAATRLGIALASPVIGFVIDHHTPGWGLAASGLGGLLFALAAAVVLRAAPARTGPVPEAGLNHS
ncbi:MFS transporter [Streptomyces sp. NPDC044780]|uniref:MFS transporter n=1 Tax=unclassified Streptomyces TaxID=2593676 RepID=UPI0033E565C5